MSNRRYAAPPALPETNRLRRRRPVYIWWAGAGFLVITTPS